MNYRTDKYGNPISALGFGCMRFARKHGSIDLAAAEQLVCEAVRQGINYFDTAYIYPGSEAALGEILQKNGLRDQVNIATKLPHYLIKSMAALERCFNEQLRRLRTDHIDYYLMHMLNDAATWQKLCGMGVLQWLQQKKQSGAIRQLGFSYHGSADAFCTLLDAYDWDFCQIQYNYLDEHTQAGRRGLQHAAAKGVPVIIMEPLRGGKLVDRLPKQALQRFAQHPAGHTPAGWAFRWLWDQPEVTCVLSGMNSMEMLLENLQTASDMQAGSLTGQERAMFSEVAALIRQSTRVGCTGCGYCMPCPAGVDIPGCFAAYNREATESRAAARKEYLMCTAMRGQSAAASQCVGCGRCEQHCPQGINIREQLAACAARMETLPYKIARKGVELLRLY